MTSDASRDLRVLVYAPIGRDSALTADVLTRASVSCQVCHSILEVCEGIRAGAGAVLLTEEALADRHITDLATTLAAQPPWSDISVLLFAGGDPGPAALRTLHTLEVLRNVTLLDRPIRISAVISTIRAALRGRQRQYELRDVLVALHAAREDAERARDEAQTANRLKEEFLATLSHELRTPLNAILGWVSLLRQARIDRTRVPKILQIVERNAQAQAQLITDVLDVSRMITGRVRLRLEPVVLSRVVLDAVDNVRPAADAKRITIAVHVEGDLPAMRGDPKRLQQVFWNLLSNAIKFTPEGGRVDVTLGRAGSHLEASVADTGIGMPPEFVPFAFERFRQADQSFTRPHGGLGLGLAIVKHLVETHGGQVSVSSDGVGRGTRFHVRLPIGTVFTQPSGDPRSDLPSTGEPNAWEQPDLGGRLILVVDDDASTRELLTTMFSQCGARVAAADSARTALGLLDAETPAIIVADIGMPEQDGLTMMRTIRRRPAHLGGEVPSIALSAYARPEDRRAALAAGFDEFLTKPATPNDVMRAVARCLVDRSHP